MSISKIEKIRLKVSIAKKVMEKLEKEKLIVSKSISSQEDILRDVRRECSHPKRYVKNTQMDGFKKCTVCEDLLFRP